MIVIGLGNEFRHDDAAGLIAARRLRDAGVAAEEYDGDLMMVMDRWKGSDAVILIDAVSSGVVAIPWLLIQSVPISFRQSASSSSVKTRHWTSLPSISRRQTKNITSE